jgi:hypothetical protein
LPLAPQSSEGQKETPRRGPVEVFQLTETALQGAGSFRAWAFEFGL